MPRAENQKARMLALYIIFLYHSDENHGLTIAQILEILKRDYEIDSTAQTVTSDFWLMDILFNITIESDNHRPKNYFMTKPALTTSDISALVECIMESRNTSADLKQRLRGKLKDFASKYSSKIFVRRETASEIDTDTVEKIDIIREAIKMQAQIKFDYPSYEFDQQAKLRHSETDWIHMDLRSYRIVSYFPLEIYYPNDTPCLFAYQINKPFFIRNEKTEREYYSLKIKFMRNIYIVSEAYSYKEPFPVDYTPESTQSFKYMSLLKTQSKERVTIEIDDYLLPYVMEYLGEGIETEKLPGEKYRVIAETYISSEFLGWVFSMGTGAKLLTPLHAANRMKQWVKSLSELYGLVENRTLDEESD